MASSISPRLPSPPPFTEVQIAPSSTPSSTPSSPLKHSPPAAIRRIRPGTKSRNVDTGLPLTCLSELDSAFQLQEHLASLLSTITNPAGSERTYPLSRVDCERLATPPEGVEENLWCYELTRRLTRDLNVLIVALLHDKCTATSCPEMRASEWQYLCAVHDSPQSCCAIDYSTHTLDHAATMLTSTKYFPSRLSLHQASVKHLASIFRRLYRIFAHAWFQHRHVFWEVEGEYGLYLFFKTVSDRYRLIPQDSLMLPPEAEGLKGKNGDAAGEESEEEEFEEWDRGPDSRRHLEGEEKSDSDEEGEGDYSDESDSDEEIVVGDVDIIDDDDEIDAAQEDEEEAMGKTKEDPLVDDSQPPGDDKEGEPAEVEDRREAESTEESEAVAPAEEVSDNEKKHEEVQSDTSDVATEHKSEEPPATHNDKSEAENKEEEKH